MFVIIVLTDNSDPLVYGPYDINPGEAGRRAVAAELQRKGVADHHVTEILIRTVRPAVL